VIRRVRMTSARAADVLRMVGNADYRDECVAGEMGADALELLAYFDAAYPSTMTAFRKMRAEWEKERKG